ncbi:MAG: hypothetical protein N0E45_16860, partial [Candidatus Thiodiazotropha endolucinida]|nr:hypothetical protein [Candidatus Thiodiazotropha taylori]MCW4301309.1 hypothetical protein [Candidatus Thiodiazotropha endolucinida]
TRKRAEQEYKQCKANENQESSGDSSVDATGEQSAIVDQSQEAGATIENVESEFSHERIASTGSNSMYPVIEVEWRGIHRGTLVFDREPGHPTR